MSLPVTAVWEVRPTVGSDTNGGGFDPAISGAGTDYSQQDAANSSGSNISTTDGVGVGTTTWASATANFTSAIVGNIIYLSGSGITTGWYEVVAFTNSTTVTLDRNPGTGTGATMNIGGALATISQAYTSAALSNTIYVKASGTYTATATLDLAGTNATPFYFIGYTSTRGDGGQVTWTTATNSTSLVKMGSAPINFVFMNFSFTNTAGTSDTGFDGGLTGQGALLLLQNCSFTGFTVAVALGYISGVHFDCAMVTMLQCTVTGCSSHGIELSGGSRLEACYIFGNGGDGVYVSVTGSGNSDSGLVVIDRCAIWDNTGVGVSVEPGGGLGNSRSNTVQLTNSAVGANGSHGVELQGASGGSANAQAFLCVNCVIESNGGYGLKNDNATAHGYFVLSNNAFRANTSGNYNGSGMVAQASDVALTAEPFTNPSSGDFSLNSTSGGGTACKQAGFPTVIGA
jgi:hypothetical protein